jgi:hypothetical protein
MAIIHSPWWSRIWTVQEAVLPPRAVVMYDSWSMLFEDFLTHYTEDLCPHLWECCQEASDLLPTEVSVTMVTSSNVCRDLRRDFQGFRLGKKKADLDSSLLAYGHRECNDPRDRICSMLGLIDTGWFAPSYSASVASVFYSATCKLLEEDPRTLQSLIGVQYGPSVYKWASWVRDFDQQCTTDHNALRANRSGTYRLFDAGGSTPLGYKIWTCWPCSPDSKPNQVALAVTGRSVGTIMSFCQQSCTFDMLFPDTFAACKALMELAEFDFEAHAKGRYTRSNEQIWRTMSGGILQYASSIEHVCRRFNADDMKLLDLLISFFDIGIAPDLQGPIGSLHRSAAMRTYCRTQDGGHGLCYPSCQAGDQVWVLHGSPVPFILRSVYVDTGIEENVLRPQEAYTRDKNGVIIGVKESFEPRTGHYQLIGDCYYDGFMDGEGLDDDKFPAQSILLV